MDEGIKAKVDSVLEGVREPQSYLSVAELDLVSHVSWSTQARRIVVEMNIGMPRFQCPACSAISGEVKRGLVRRLREEFEIEFPGYAIDIA